MKAAKLIFIVLAQAEFLSACAASKAEEEATPSDAYDAALAAEVGADDYGMRSYVFVVLKTGPADITDKARRDELFAGHFASMGRLAEEGKLVLAGPFIDGGDMRGLYIYNVATIEEAEALVLNDPAVAAGIFTPEFTKYYGSAALMKINELHAKVQKKAM